MEFPRDMDGGEAEWEEFHLLVSDSGVRDISNLLVLEDREQGLVVQGKEEVGDIKIMARQQLLKIAQKSDDTITNGWIVFSCYFIVSTVSDLCGF